MTTHRRRTLWLAGAGTVIATPLLTVFALRNTLIEGRKECEALFGAGAKECAFPVSSQKELFARGTDGKNYEIKTIRLYSRASSAISGLCLNIQQTLLGKRLAPWPETRNQIGLISEQSTKKSIEKMSTFYLGPLQIGGKYFDPHQVELSSTSHKEVIIFHFNGIIRELPKAPRKESRHIDENLRHKIAQLPSVKEFHLPSAEISAPSAANEYGYRVKGAGWELSAFFADGSGLLRSLLTFSKSKIRKDDEKLIAEILTFTDPGSHRAMFVDYFSKLKDAGRITSAVDHEAAKPLPKAPAP